MMVRFLDLTLILLMAFLFKADLVVEHEVALPHGSEPTGNAGLSILSLTITESGWHLEDGRRDICSGGGIDGLDDCLSGHGAGTQVQIIPESGVHVQRLVNVLDACARTATICAPMGS